MLGKNHQTLHIPQGTETFFLEEAFRHRRIREQIETIFTGWGFMPIQTPLFDYFDNYRKLFSSEDLKRIFRLFDRDGDLLMLRSDITLFLVKQLVFLYRGDQPLRVCYSDAVLRHQNREDITHSEFYQVGAELIGKKGIDGDLEMLTLLISILSDLKLDDASIHIGSRPLLDPLLAELEEEDRSLLISAVVHRQWEHAKELLEEKEIAHSDSWMSLLQFIGSSRELSKLLKELPPAIREAADSATQSLAEVFRLLESVDCASRCRIDLSEVGEKPYYTGHVYKAYLPGVASEIATGGRYDKLLGYFGNEAPSVGFTLFLRKIEPGLRNDLRFAPPEFATATHSNSFTENFKQARTLRESGKAATL